MRSSQAVGSPWLQQWLQSRNSAHKTCRASAIVGWGDLLLRIHSLAFGHWLSDSRTNNTFIWLPSNCCPSFTYLHLFASSMVKNFIWTSHPSVPWTDWALGTLHPAQCYTCELHLEPPRSTAQHHNQDVRAIDTKHTWKTAKKNFPLSSFVQPQPPSPQSRKIRSV